ncbi:MAG: hypothetical protein RIN55_03040 [Tissierellaceae bacterium]|nr:hypothetical protein [Tissierellaceae bacterium]
MKKNLYTGIALIVLGILYLLNNFNMLDLTWILFLTSIALIIRYILKKETLILVVGLALLAFSSVSLIDRYIFINLNIKPFVYLSVGGSGLLYLYYKSRERNWLIFGSVLIALAFNNLIGQVLPVLLPWAKYFFLALAFYTCYLVAYRRNSIVWPKYISYTLLFIGSIQAFVNIDLLRYSNFKLNYVIPIIIIFVGARIIYMTFTRR